MFLCSIKCSRKKMAAYMNVRASFLQSSWKKGHIGFLCSLRYELFLSSLRYAIHWKDRPNICPVQIPQKAA